MNEIKVLGFDGWTMGAHHYVRLLKAFQENNIALTLIHLGSWSEDKGREKEENIDGLIVRDISYYNKSNFEEILNIEKPDLVLFLSTETFAHRAFQRYCRHRNVPTIYLYHGLCSVFRIDGSNEVLHSTKAGLARFVFGQAYKSIRYTFPAYARSLWKTSATWLEWVRFIQDVFFRLRGKTIFVPAADAIPTKCCVYISADIQDAISRFRLGKCDVAVVGNPDLLAFKLRSEDIGIFNGQDSSYKNHVMYIDAGLASLGLNFKSVDEYAKFLIQIGDQLRAQHKILLFKIKPHPPEYNKYLSGILSDNNIEVVENKDFVDKLKACCACITEPSTLGLIPALIGMPLFLIRIGQLEALRYGSVFTTYPRAQYLDNVGRFNELLMSELGSCDPNQVMTWISENSGPMPAEDMPKRVTQVILDLIRTRRDASVCAENAECQAG